jgi:hypothetical protein
MTHSQAVATNPVLEPTACPGELVESVSLPDRHFAEGRIHERTVDVYLCSACGFHVSMTGHVALNHYHVPEPRALVAALASHVDARSRAQRRD